MSNKAIGQYFSGNLVADLLVLASDIDNTDTMAAIDPMVGSADMLDALRRAGTDEPNLYGIDVDNNAIAVAKNRLTHGHFLAADAFSASSIDVYKTRSWDLVITNPPYVRYQSLAELYGKNAVEVLRNRLVSTIEALDIEGAKEPYLTSAKSYSGLADLAVPCWILCACLVRPGGKLAMVLPDAWLKREYSSAIRDILAVDFHIDRIVVDESRCWFEDAQVKTNLLVATKRCDERTRAGSRSVHYIGITKRASTHESLVGNLEYGERTGEEAFIELCHDGACLANDTTWARHEDVAGATPATHISDQMRAATLRDWGFSVGQGLRTGANDFFYFETDQSGRVRNRVWEDCAGNEATSIQELPLIPALRYQDEVGSSYRIAKQVVNYHLLYITQPLSPTGSDDVPADDAALRRYIEYCEEHDVSNGRRRRRIPLLSAVRTNGPTSKVPDSARYWYMLPALRDRHMPDALIPRINGGPVKTYLLPDGRRTVVDANFSTLWTTGEDHSEKYAALALLNSTYTRLELERTCAVLGGGALKCEAVSLRKLRVPPPSERLESALLKLGRELADAPSTEIGDNVISRIDLAIALELADGDDAKGVLTRWTDELGLRLKVRSE